MPSKKRLTEDEVDLLGHALDANGVHRKKVDLEKLVEDGGMAIALQTAVAVDNAYREGLNLIYEATEHALIEMGRKRAS